MIFAVIVFWLPGALLVASAVRRSRNLQPVPLPSRPVGTPGRASNSGLEVWTSPFRTEPDPPQRWSIHDYGLGRLVGAGVLTLMGILAVTVYPFAGSRAHHTTTVRMPDALVGLARTGWLSDTARAEDDRLLGIAGVDQVDSAGYGPPTRLAPVSLIVFAGRGDYPVGKIEPEPGGLLMRLLPPFDTSDGVDGTKVMLGNALDFPGVDVARGNLAAHAHCWKTNSKLAATACEFWSDTFFVEVIDFRATDLERAGRQAREVVQHVISVPGHAAPPDGVTGA